MTAAEPRPTLAGRARAGRAAPRGRRGRGGRHGPAARSRLADVVAVHADADDVPDDGADPDDDLGWYATQEIPDLLVDSERGPRIERGPGSSDNIAGMDAVTHPPHPVNEPNLTYAPGQRRAGGAGRRAGAAGASAGHTCAPTSAAAGATAAAPRSRSSSRTTTSTCSAP